MSAAPDGEPSFVPVLVVVGNVNQGKSSVVAALSEDDLIPVASHPGTTRISGEYKVTVGDRELLRIVDTPGFQRPRQALAWLRRRAASAAETVSLGHFPKASDHVARRSAAFLLGQQLIRRPRSSDRMSDERLAHSIDATTQFRLDLRIKVLAVPL